MEVFFQVTILRNRYWHHCINGLWKVLMKHLFPGRSVMDLEHILELHEGVWPVEFTFFSPFVKLGDSFVDGKLNTIFTIIFMDVNATFVSQIFALKFVNFRQVGIVIVPGLFYDLI